MAIFGGQTQAKLEVVSDGFLDKKTIVSVRERPLRPSVYQRIIRKYYTGMQTRALVGLSG